MRVLVSVSVSFLLTFCERWHKYLHRNKNNNILKEAEENDETRALRLWQKSKYYLFHSRSYVERNERKALHEFREKKKKTRIRDKRTTWICILLHRRRTQKLTFFYILIFSNIDWAYSSWAHSVRCRSEVSESEKPKLWKRFSFQRVRLRA